MKTIFQLIPDLQLALQLRRLIESDLPIVILGSDQQARLEFFKQVCRGRLPRNHQLGLFSSNLTRAELENSSIHWIEKAPDISTEQFVRSALRQDPDGILLDHLEASEVQLLANVLLTGHSFGTTVVVSQKDLSSLRHDWQQALGDQMLGMVLGQLVFIEAGISSGEVVVKSVGKFVFNEAGEQIDFWAERREYSGVEGRDPSLERQHQAYWYKEFPLPPIEFKTRSSRPKVLTEAQLQEWQRAAKTTKERPAKVPLCRELSAEEKKTLSEFVLSPSNPWPRYKTSAQPMSLLMQIETKHLPAGLQAHFGVDQVVQFFYESEDGALTEGEDRFSPWTSLAQVIVRSVKEAQAGFPSVVPLNLLRENYVIEKFIDLPDSPGFPESPDSAGCVPFNKFSGWPCWVQEAEYPSCPDCQRSMSLFMQMDGQNGEFDLYFGADFFAYLFFCEIHRERWAFVQQTS